MRSASEWRAGPTLCARAVQHGERRAYAAQIARYLSGSIPPARRAPVTAPGLLPSPNTERPYRPGLVKKPIHGGGAPSGETIRCRGRTKYFARPDGASSWRELPSDFLRTHRRPSTPVQARAVTAGPVLSRPNTPKGGSETRQSQRPTRAYSAARSRVPSGAFRAQARRDSPSSAPKQLAKSSHSEQTGAVHKVNPSAPHTMR